MKIVVMSPFGIEVECCQILKCDVVFYHQVRNLNALQPGWVGEPGLGFLALSF
jgi:hypothetical protein